MAARNFRQLLEARWAQGKFVCVGLDSDFAKIPASAHRNDTRSGATSPRFSMVAFNSAIVDATHDLVCAYKPNAAFYEAEGPEGASALIDTVAYINEVAPDVPVILDAKRADIGNTNNGYMKAAFDIIRADAITVHPYLGREALQPFLDRADKGVIVLCRTSNPGAGEFQSLEVRFGRGAHRALYQEVARRVSAEWNEHNNCCLVVGATYPEELGEVREIARDIPILIPGVGFQQKDVPLATQVRQVIMNGQDSRGRGMIINSSRGIIFASSGDDFAEAAWRETQKLHDLITAALAA